MDAGKCRVVIGVINGNSVQRRSIHKTHRAIRFDEARTHLPITAAVQIELGSLSGHIRECFIDPAGLSGINQIGITIGEIHGLSRE